MTKPTAEPAARTVFAQRTFSAVKGSIVGRESDGEEEESGKEDEEGWRAMVPTKVWMSFIGGSARRKEVNGAFS
jgi:hypothetical protein